MGSPLPHGSRSLSHSHSVVNCPAHSFEVGVQDRIDFSTRGVLIGKRCEREDNQKGFLGKGGKKMSMADLYKRFADVHPNIGLKTDVLRQGLKISQSAQQEFNRRDDLLWRGFWFLTRIVGK